MKWTKKKTDDLILRDKGCFDIHCIECFYDDIISCLDDITYKKLLKQKKISEILK